MSEMRDELSGSDSGVWLVTTASTRHLWDLDTMTYVRVPGSSSLSKALPLDLVPCRIRSVEDWPRVGFKSLVWIDDPLDGGGRQWRLSSMVESIVRVSPADLMRLGGVGRSESDDG